MAEGGVPFNVLWLSILVILYSFLCLIANALLTISLLVLGERFNCKWLLDNFSQMRADDHLRYYINIRGCPYRNYRFNRTTDTLCRGLG